MSIYFEPATSAAQIERIALLAQEIWYDYYVPLIGKAQVDYMVAKFQSAAAMLEQTHDGYSYFTIESELIEPHQGALGYLAVQPQPSGGGLFISKLYLRRTARARGTGRLALRFIEGMARRQALSYVWLTVNKGNPAVSTYQRWGFRIAAAIVIDIGGGFVMDDYRMEKTLDAP